MRILEPHDLAAVLQVADGLTRLEDPAALAGGTRPKLGKELRAAAHGDTRQLAAGLLVQDGWVSAALVAALSLPSSYSMQAQAAGSMTQTITVTATVPPWVKLHLEHQQAQLTVTPADVARGYVEVSAASRFAVTTNNRAGYSLNFHLHASIFRSAVIHGPGVSVEVGAGGGTVTQRGAETGVARTRVELGYRFYLAEGAQPGTYFWPLSVSARAL